MNEHSNSLQRKIQKLSPNKGDLLVIYPDRSMTILQHDQLTKSLEPFAARIGCNLLVSQPGIQVDLQPNSAAILDEMRKQTELLRLMTKQQVMLIDALAGSEAADPDAEPSHYMDGTLIPGRS
ncbi:hypothetical protein [Pseudomonas syringae]|uniref:Uncharacterized protein n=3 Tax=Pseudomonas syringae TaxID=317 RepID=A0A656JII6_PSESF|nr:hypothetical protein [Pseudomonas syringae]EPN26630.1 hypothetical protein A245_47835 [Pseudomonas syringae pv. actinidiae ICMP 19096]EPM43226.1 hypothetical protein A246_27814 [Pseudomonas syringae pv. actinidiae ICMP 19098]EPM64875.1 hypothetical protein A249_42196 [Pseudomonas syringae pv. actinidiae ICMP 18804]EPN21311.1 hypothetical protein A248_03298 [Pseudomonas syringae pv. actinidiae ICMP 19100]EPN24152.1 hypothetical protein A247_22328 [Pseudomonas syringae pv. actinidiae ICMP 190